MTGVRLVACLAAAFALLTACGESHAGAIDPYRSLLITDVAVVADPERTVDPCTGAATLPVWSFGYLMQELVAQRPDVTTQEFVRRWLALFATTQNVNGQRVATTLVPLRKLESAPVRGSMCTKGVFVSRPWQPVHVFSEKK